MLAFLFTSYELFVTLPLMRKGAADNLSVILFGTQKEQRLPVHAKIVYYV